MITRPLLSTHNLQVNYPLPGNYPWQNTQYLTAVNNVSISVQPGETLAIVGESGCGKSSLARALIGLIPASGGQIYWQDQDITHYSALQHQQLCKQRQMIFQDPFSSLNPRMTVGDIIAEPLRYLQPDLTHKEREKRVLAIMERVGLTTEQRQRYPHEFSGGQCQRIGIARALIVEPKLLICDEPVSALDVSIQAQIINLLQSLQQEMPLSIIFITHNLSIAKHIADSILVMYLGKVMEMGQKNLIFNHAKHPYTQELLKAVPIPNPAIERQKPPVLLKDEIPSPLNPPSGCVFHTRCKLAIAQCALTTPTLKNMSDTRQIACLLADDEG